MPDGAGEGIGWLYRLTDGGAEAVADLAAFETASNPDVDQPGNTEPDSNAHGLAAAPAKIPTRLLTHPQPGLLGAAYCGGLL
jgi:hypothetical protein